MKTYNLKDYTRGWIIGDFEPSLIKTKDFEVGIKEYKRGDNEPSHYHKVANEITIVTHGSCRINEKVYKQGDIVHVEPGEVVQFEALEDCITTVVKIPSVIGDKYSK